MCFNLGLSGKVVIVNTSASNRLERLVSKMTYNELMGMLNLAQSLTVILWAVAVYRRQFAESVASAMELLGRESFGTPPLGRCPLIAAHFRRILDKRSQLLVEDKLESLLSCVSQGSATITWRYHRAPSMSY